MLVSNILFFMPLVVVLFLILYFGVVPITACLAKILVERSAHFDES